MPRRLYDGGRAVAISNLGIVSKHLKSMARSVYMGDIVSPEVSMAPDKVPGSKNDERIDSRLDRPIREARRSPSRLECARFPSLRAKRVGA